MLRYSYDYSLIIMLIVFFMIYIIANKHNYINEYHQQNKFKKWSILSLYKFIKDIFCFVREKYKNFIIMFIILLVIEIVFSKLSGYSANKANTPLPNIEPLTWTEVINYIPDLVIISLQLTIMGILVIWLANKEGWQG